MSLIDERIAERVQKAIQRSGSQDLAALRDRAVDKQPVDLASDQDLARRRQFLLQTSDNETDARRTFERIIQGNELQDVNYLARGLRASRAVGRISIREPNGRLAGYGTGFLIGNQVLLTNNHVLLGPSLAERSEVEFEYERDEAGRQLPGVKFSLLPQTLFFTHTQLDFSVVAVAPQALNADRALSEFEYLPLLGSTGKTVEGEWLTIIQHPRGELKQLCVRENRLLEKGPDVLWYSTDTLGGSSGSPVFNNDWLVVALHHSGVPETKDGKWQTIDGQDYDPKIHREEDIKWVANEGIRVSRILDTLRQELGTHALIQPVISHLATELSAQTSPLVTPTAMNTPNLTTIAGRQYVITFDAAGRPSIAPFSGAPAVESAFLAEKSTPAARRVPPPARGVSFRFDDDYSKRAGYDPKFLKKGTGAGKFEVHLPKLSAALEADAVRLIEPKNDKDYVLHYTNMSLVMHQKRSFAIYSAANLDFANRYKELKSKRVWRYDPRIPLNVQTGDEAYAGNAFDRGHLTRQEDLEYGATMQDALQSTADTCHWTNVCTQHAKFNQTKDWWQGMERHILEYAVNPTAKEGFRAQVFTGPVFSKNDPEYPEVKDLRIPMKFWKVCVAINASDKLFAVAYLLDQSPVIKQFGLKEAAPEVPFKPYKLFQLPISELETMINLKFTYGANDASLSKCDPLDGAPLPILDADQDGDDDRLESTGLPTKPTPQGWVNLDRNSPFFG